MKLGSVLEQGKQLRALMACQQSAGTLQQQGSRFISLEDPLLFLMWSGACRYFDFVNFNTTGYRPYVTTLYAVLLGCLRKSISRILVLIVSMGFGVVLPYLGAIQHKVGRPLLHTLRL